MISVFLERTTIAALVSLAVYVVACLPYVITFNIEFSVEISFVQKIFVVSTHNRLHDVFIPFSLNIETNNFFPKSNWSTQQFSNIHQFYFTISVPCICIGLQFWKSVHNVHRTVSNRCKMGQYAWRNCNAIQFCLDIDNAPSRWYSVFPNRMVFPHSIKWYVFSNISKWLGKVRLWTT